MMERQYGYSRRHADIFGLGDDARQEQIRPAVHPKGIEVMLADPGGMIPKLVRENRLFPDLRDDCVRRPVSAGLLIVA